MVGQETASKVGIVAPFAVTSPIVIADELEDKQSSDCLSSQESEEVSSLENIILFDIQRININYLVEEIILMDRSVKILLNS
jgi:hypothetical protein